MKRGHLKKSKKCDHKFIDSKSCLKCGWTPPPITDPSPRVAPLPPFSFRVTEHENTRLRVGDVVLYGELNAEHVVCKVNNSCARIIPVGASTKAVSFTPRFADKPVNFTAPVKTDPIAISANSECEILRRLGPNWREKLNMR